MTEQTKPIAPQEAEPPEDFGRALRSFAEGARNVILASERGELPPMPKWLTRWLADLGETLPKAASRLRAAADHVGAKLLCDLTPDDTLPNNSLMERVRFALARKDKLRAIIEDSEARRTEERNAAEQEVERLREALREIVKCEGAYSMDRLTHAHNTIEHLVQLATDALDASSLPREGANG